MNIDTLTYCGPWLVYCPCLAQGRLNIHPVIYLAGTWGSFSEGVTRELSALRFVLRLLAPRFFVVVARLTRLACAKCPVYVVVSGYKERPVRRAASGTRGTVFGVHTRIVESVASARRIGTHTADPDRAPARQRQVYDANPPKPKAAAGRLPVTTAPVAPCSSGQQLDLDVDVHGHRARSAFEGRCHGHIGARRHRHLTPHVAHRRRGWVDREVDDAHAAHAHLP